MNSQFLQLFKRGRYVSIRSLATAEMEEAKRRIKHEERERFSVAAVSFCLKYDSTFKAHFLKVIAGLSPRDIKEITLEPKQWGDLVLEGRKHILVLEFKLGALLQDHQSPASRIFSEDGYGARILNHWRKTDKTLLYIVIGKDFRRRMRDGLPCSAVPWANLLLCGDRQESAMEKDLYDCLGYLGAPVFLNRHMKNTHLSGDARQGMNLYASLQHLLEIEGIPEGRADSDATYFGINISRAKSTSVPSHAKLGALVQPNGSLLGWIGYEVVEEDKPPYLSVWFYSTTKTASAVRKRLGAGKGIGLVGTSEDANVYVRLASEKSSNDIAWFKKILRRVTAC